MAIEAAEPGALGVGGSAGAGEPGFHGVGVDQAGLLEGEVAAAEHCEVRDALDLIACGEFGVLLRVDFEDDGAAGEIAGGLRNVGGGHTAGSAPGGPEIDEDGDAGFADDFVELGGADGDGLGDGRKRILAVAAAASIREVARGDAVGFAASGTGAQDGHGVLQYMDASGVIWAPDFHEHPPALGR